MKFLQKTLPIALGVAFMAPLAVNAQSKFDGFFGQVAVGYETISPSLTSSPVTSPTSSAVIPTSISASSNSGFSSAIAAGYTWSFNKDYNIALDVAWLPTNSQQTTSTLVIGGRGYPATSKTVNRYRIAIQPGMNVGTDGLAYFKVGYAAGENQTTGASGDVYNTNHNGYVLGLGYKQFITGGLYGFGEFNYSSMNKQNTTNSFKVGANSYSYTVTNTSSSSNVMVGLGYRF